MAKEIERKFLVTDDSYRDMSARSVEVMQGYLSTRKEATVRVRIWGDCGYLTVKGAMREPYATSGSMPCLWPMPVRCLSGWPPEPL